MFRSQSMGAHNGILNLFKISQIDVLLCLHFTFSHDGTRLVWDRPHRMACIIFKLEDFYFASRVAYMKTIWMWMFAANVWKSVCDVCAFAQRVIRRSSGCSRQMHFEGVAFVLFEREKNQTKNTLSREQRAKSPTNNNNNNSIRLALWVATLRLLCVDVRQPASSRTRANNHLFIFFSAAIGIKSILLLFNSFCEPEFWWHTAKLNECLSPLIDRWMDRSNVIAKVSNDGRDNINVKQCRAIDASWPMSAGSFVRWSMWGSLKSKWFFNSCSFRRDIGCGRRVRAPLLVARVGDLFFQPFFSWMLSLPQRSSAAAKQILRLLHNHRAKTKTNEMSWNLLVRCFSLSLLRFCWFWLRFLCRHWACVRCAHRIYHEREHWHDGALRTSTQLYYEIFRQFCISFGIIVTWLTMRRQPLALLYCNTADTVCQTRKLEHVHWEVWRHPTNRCENEILIDLFVTETNFVEDKLDAFEFDASPKSFDVSNSPIKSMVILFNMKMRCAEHFRRNS